MQVPKHDEINMGYTVAIWRDGSGWLYPARGTKVTPFYYEVQHNGRLKTSGVNRTRFIRSNKSEERNREELTERFPDPDHQLLRNLE